MSAWINDHNRDERLCLHKHKGKNIDMTTTSTTLVVVLVLSCMGDKIDPIFATIANMSTLPPHSTMLVLTILFLPGSSLSLRSTCSRHLSWNLSWKSSTASPTLVLGSTHILRGSHTRRVAQRIYSLLTMKTLSTRSCTTSHVLVPSIVLSLSVTKSREEKGCANWAAISCPAGCHDIPGEGRKNKMNVSG